MSMGSQGDGESDPRERASDRSRWPEATSGSEKGRHPDGQSHPHSMPRVGSPSKQIEEREMGAVTDHLYPTKTRVWKF